MTPNDGGPAFPGFAYTDGRGNMRINEQSGEWEAYEPGMSLRDWLAGQEYIDPVEEYGWELLEAIAGPRPDGNWKTNALNWLLWSCKWQAAIRYARADAMLAARGGAK